MEHEIELFPGTYLRSMQTADCATAAKLDAECPVQGQMPCPEAVFHFRLKMPEFHQWIVEVGENAVGVVVIVVNEGWFDFLKICLNDYGRGLGPRIIQAMKDFGKQCGCTYLVGRCVPELFPFYEKQGAVATGELPHYFGPGKKAIALRAPL